MHSHFSQKDEKSKKKKNRSKVAASTNVVGSSDGEDSCVRESNDSGNYVLYTSAFKWIPIGEQKQWFEVDQPKMVHGDIILAKMRPGQEIEARFLFINFLNFFLKMSLRERCRKRPCEILACCYRHLSSFATDYIEKG